MHEVLVNRLGGLSLPRKSVVRPSRHDLRDSSGPVFKTRWRQESFQSLTWLFSCTEPFIIAHPLPDMTEIVLKRA